MGRWVRCLGLALGLAAAGCGGGSLIIVFNSGVIVGDPICDAAGGRFDLRDSGGLVVVVVVTDDTTIVVAGSGGGTCGDLFAGATVDVSGRDAGGELLASEITVR